MKEIDALVEYSFEEAKETAKEYFGGDDLAADVWVNKYALKDSDGHIYENSPEQMHRRIAGEIARIENGYPNAMSASDVFELLDHFKYLIPQGGPMSGIGNTLQIVSLSNCFVIGHNNPADSYGGIIRIDEEQVQLMKRRGGVGHDLSHIRPRKSQVLNSALTSTGIVPFMERYSNSTREVAQDGRRGALMLTLSVKHPDAEDFIDAKTDSKKVTGANVSIKVDDEFMQAAIDGGEYVQQFPIRSASPKKVKTIDAKSLWNKIVHNAWNSAEPGVLFWDTILRESIADCYADEGFETVSTNPCGEIPLCPYDSCRLLALNLYGYVDAPFTKEAKFNFEKLRRHTNRAMRMMDDIIDLELEKIEQILKKIKSDPEDIDIRRVEINLWEKIRDKALKGRRTGLGITAEGDMLAALGLTYGSDEAIEFATLVQKSLALAAYEASVEMAEERGAFPIFDAMKEKNNPMIGRIREADPVLYDRMVRNGRRNISMLTIAPTGSTSILSQTTSGIEPLFLPLYMRKRKVNPTDQNAKIDFTDATGDSWEQYVVLHHKLIEWMGVNGFSTENTEHLSREEVNAMVAQSPYYKATSDNIDWVAKVKMQGALQKWVDHSISVTINLPKDATEELVALCYETAWKSGCKGITVYREGSRDGVMTDETKAADANVKTSRPTELEADLVRFKNGTENWVAFVGLMNGRPYEIFTGLAQSVIAIPDCVKTGFIVKTVIKKGNETTKRYDFKYDDCDGIPQQFNGISRLFNKEYWNYAKLISGVLRHGMAVPDVVNLVEGLTLDNETINSWKNGVVRALHNYIADGTVKTGMVCPVCGSENIIYIKKCPRCKECGHGECV